MRPQQAAQKCTPSRGGLRIADLVHPEPAPSASNSLRRMQSQSKSFRCKHCKRTMASRADLETHISQIHRLPKDPKKPLQCDLCDSTFGLKWNMNQHKNRVHEGKRPFPCKQCGDTFGTRYDLNRHHKHVHETKCTLCDLDFPTNKEFKKHHAKKHPRRAGSGGG